MKVSVLIPTRNRPDYLTRALRSVMSQSYEAWEALIIDDGNGQGLRTAESLGDARIQALPNAGQGQVDARNTALEHASGSVIALLDDDDWWEDTGHLGKVVTMLQRCPALVHRPGWLVFEQGMTELRRELFAHATTPQSLRENNTILASSLAYPKSFHDELGPFDANVGSYYDWDWSLRVLDAGYPLTSLPLAGIGYSVREGGTSAVPDTPRRRQNFEAFREKHALEIVIKNHASLHAEAAEES